MKPNIDLQRRSGAFECRILELKKRLPVLQELVGILGDELVSTSRLDPKIIQCGGGSQVPLAIQHLEVKHPRCRLLISKFGVKAFSNIPP
jgi:hypothetical protein